MSQNGVPAADRKDIQLDSFDMLLLIHFARSKSRPVIALSPIFSVLTLKLLLLHLVRKQQTYATLLLHSSH